MSSTSEVRLGWAGSKPKDHSIPCIKQFQSNRKA